MLDLRSKTRQRLLAYYFTNPTARHHLRDLADRLSADPSNLSKELRRLEREGLFASEISGRQKYFHLNRDYPLLEEVGRIVAKTIGVAPLLAQSSERGRRHRGGLSLRFVRARPAGRHERYRCPPDRQPQERRPCGSNADTPNASSVARSITPFSPRKEFQARRARNDTFLEDVWRHKRVPLLRVASE